MAERTLFPDVYAGLDSDGEQTLQNSFDKARQLAVEVHAMGISAALDGAFMTANALLASMNARCRRSAPPAEIEMTTDATGRLIYRCKHTLPHEWPI